MVSDLTFRITNCNPPFCIVANFRRRIRAITESPVCQLRNEDSERPASVGAKERYPSHMVEDSTAYTLGKKYPTSNFVKREEIRVLENEYATLAAKDMGTL
jgi:hypothetical protein